MICSAVLVPVLVPCTADAHCPDVVRGGRVVGSCRRQHVQAVVVSTSCGCEGRPARDMPASVEIRIKSPRPPLPLVF